MSNDTRRYKDDIDSTNTLRDKLEILAHWHEGQAKQSRRYATELLTDQEKAHPTASGAMFVTTAHQMANRHEEWARLIRRLDDIDRECGISRLPYPTLDPNTPA